MLLFLRYPKKLQFDNLWELLLTLWNSKLALLAKKKYIREHFQNGVESSLHVNPCVRVYQILSKFFLPLRLESGTNRYKDIDILWCGSVNASCMALVNIFGLMKRTHSVISNAINSAIHDANYITHLGHLENFTLKQISNSKENILSTSTEFSTWT